MKFTLPRFLTALAVTVLLGILAVSGLRALGVLRPGADPGEPAALAEEAADALEAVRERQPGDRRPASYDAVLMPLDKLLALAKATIEGEAYDPVADFEKIRSMTLPVIDVALRADEQAKTETAFLAKDYRFADQRGEASQYLANAMWERILRNLPRRSGYFEEGAEYPQAAMEELRRVLDAGAAAAPDNAELLYIRGVVNRAEGQLGPAARDLEAAVAVDARHSAAWNTLGLVRIGLREFDKAEEALERARALEQENAERNRTGPGAEYVAVVHNLASFHEGLAAFYNREYRVNPTVEAQRLARRHSAEARKYYGEFLQHEPAGSPDAEEARAKLQTLP